ncbi:MAG: cytochrome c [Burkholderiales bacterium]|nr:cytochrome c [Burkholderiales bacterium]
MRAAAFIALASACIGASAWAQMMTVTGKQVPARADAAPVAQTTSVRATYIVHCAGCHGLDGVGSRVGQVPDMRRLGQFLQLEGGREFLIKVPGVMGSGLSDRQVADVSNWVLATLAADSVPAGHRPYDAAEVARARASPLVDVAAARQRLVEQGRARGIAIDPEPNNL